MIRWTFAFAAFLILLAVPTSTAQSDSESIRVHVDADEMVFQMVEPVSGEDAAEIRAEIDEDHGNGDGIVQANEIQAYQDDNRVTFTRERPECFDRFELVRIDGRGPTRLAEIREEIIGALNTNVRSTQTLHEVSVFHFAYRKPASDEVAVTFFLRDWYGALTAAGCSVGGGVPSGYPGSNYPTYPGGAEPDPGTEYRIYPWGDAQIRRDSVRPDAVRGMWDGKGLRADTDSEAGLLFANRVTFTTIGGSEGGTNFVGTARDVGAIIGYTTIGIVSLAGIAALATEFARYKFLKLLFLIPGFSRLEKDEVLEHNKRDELYRFIKTTPGPSFSDLRRELGLSNGTLVHHLRILEAQEYVKSVRDGFRTRFYVRGPKIVPTSYLTRTQQQLLEAIGANPGLTQKELSLVLGLPRESISYHAKQLAQKGRLQIKQDGKWRRYWPSPQNVSAPLQPGTGSGSS